LAFSRRQRDKERPWLLRDGIDLLAVEDEDTAYERLVETDEEQVRAALAHDIELRRLAMTRRIR
jgi:hypothetical protein